MELFEKEYNSSDSMHVMKHAQLLLLSLRYWYFLLKNEEEELNFFLCPSESQEKNFFLLNNIDYRRKGVFTLIYHILILDGIF